MDKQLEQAIIEQLGYESIDDEELKQTLADVCRGGGNAGWGGFTYCAEMEDFFKSNKKAIVDHLKEQASDFGSDSLIGMIKGFNCLKDSGVTEDEIGAILYGSKYDGEMASSIIDALCWAVLEDLAFQYDC